ncbi:MAG: DUF3783 domain-containing protein [Desulfosarcinaceae bacterium]|nr:DUF3783 domain-containing protein [Desulfosarcinaceae bacterium]
MSDTDATFDKLDASQQPLMGPRRLILCGFDAPAQADFSRLVKVSEIDEVDLCWSSSEDGAVRLDDLFKQPASPPKEPAPDHPRAVIAGGLLQKEFHLLMNLSRQVGLPATLWAVLTPTSATWTLNALLTELAAERAAMARQRK